MGYPCSLDIDENININTLYNNLKNGNPHITSGFRNSPERVGHAWIWDGMRGYVNGSTITLDAIHCNWGWNSSNGWYTSYEQPFPDVESYYDDNCQLYITLK